MNLRVAIIGGGFVGLTTAVGLAEHGHDVTVVETDERRASRVRTGKAPFFEPGLDEALGPVMTSGTVRVANGLDAVAPCEVVFLCVGTPSAPDGSADLSQIERAASDVGRALARWGNGAVVAVKSTVPPGTTSHVVRPILVASKVRFALAMVPEFLREGSALADARAPDRIVIGALDPGAEAPLRALFARFECPMLVTTPETAEMIKYAANALLATKVSFSNEVANLCERVGVNVDDVMRGVGLDHRIGPHFLAAGLGFGGSCFPKDVRAFRALARLHHVRLGILDAVLDNNDTQPLRAVELARDALGTLEGKRVALLGLAFKAGTSDVRETRALPIYEALVKAGAEVVCHDPVGGEEFAALARGAKIVRDVREALRGADACIVQTAWPEYREIAASEFVKHMRTPVVVDGRRLLDAAALSASSARLYALGRGDLR